MKVFISWSGEKSHQAALALRDWLPTVIQALDTPWVSSEDIEAGANWSNSVGGELEATSFGIICVTRENQARQWLNFEAGAISKLLGNAAPLLIDFDGPQDLTGPLSQLQVTMPTKTGMHKLMSDINAKLAAVGDRSLGRDVLDRSFELNWPSLENQLAEIRAMASATPPSRGLEDKVDEMLALVRALESRAVRPVPRPLRVPIGARLSFERSVRDLFKAANMRPPDVLWSPQSESTPIVVCYEPVTPELEKAVQVAGSQTGIQPSVIPLGPEDIPLAESAAEFRAARQAVLDSAKGANEQAPDA